MAVGYVNKTGLPWKAVFDITVNQNIPSFLEDAAAGTLRQVSWIDPAFTNFNPLGWPVNDDHPMADVKDGQDLVLAVYDALASSPQWDRCLLVIVYDENGGFYNHVAAPGRRRRPRDVRPLRRARARDHRLAVDRAAYRVAHPVRSHLDHQDDPAALLPGGLRSAARASKRRRLGPGPQHPGTRVAQASHLGELLTRGTPRPARPRDALVRQAAARADRTETGQPGAGQKESGNHPLNDLQKSILAATHQLRADGHPPNTP